MPITNRKTVIKVAPVIPIKIADTVGSVVPKLDLSRQIPMPLTTKALPMNMLNATQK